MNTVFVVTHLISAFFILPIFLFFFCFTKGDERIELRRFPFGIAFVFFCILAFSARWLSQDPGIQLIASSLMLYFIMKMIRIYNLKFDISVLVYIDRFLIFFVFPSNVRYLLYK